MYHMIGGDDREYGPVTAEQLREWITAGRADAQTRVRREGETEYKPLSTLAEFTDALAGHAAKPPAGASAPEPGLLASSSSPHSGAPPLPLSSMAAATDADAIAAEALSRDYQVNVGLSLGRAWDLLKSDFWPIIGVSAVVLLLLGISGAAYVGIVVYGPLMGGLFAYYLKHIRGEAATINDAFMGFSKNFLQLFLGGLVSALLMALGIFLCVIPGIYLEVAWWMTFPILMEKQIGFWDGMEVSRRVMTKHWWGMFLLLLVCFFLNLGGALLCGVGTFVTMPLTLIATAYVYDDLFGPARAAGS